MTTSAIPVIYASEAGARLDSNVHTGGGTDDTAVLQAVLDKAREGRGVHLVMDGAALIHGLVVYSNTTITCPNKDCGFYLADGVNRALLVNANQNYKEITTRNITIQGGTYNHNCLHQDHDYPAPKTDDFFPDVFGNVQCVMGFIFIGVENLIIRDITLTDQRTFGMLIANWKHVDMDNIDMPLPNHIDYQNQDGIHFWGPGQFLTMHNIRGRSGDDFIALAPDEHDGTSSITDVLIDGVFLDGADQGIRLLSRGSGRLDRVTIRNVTGTYKSYGFYINSWFPGDTCGNYGHITFENISLRSLAPNYTYRENMLFHIGGEVECLTLRHIYDIDAYDDRPLFECSGAFAVPSDKGKASHIQSLIIEDIHIQNRPAGPHPIGRLACAIDYLAVDQVDFVASPGLDSLLKTEAGCNIETLRLSHIYAENTPALLCVPEGEIGNVYLHDVLCRNASDNGIHLSGGRVRHILQR